MRYPRPLKKNIYHSNKQESLPFFPSESSPVLGHVWIRLIGKTHVLVVTMGLIWLLLLNILSFNFVATSNKVQKSQKKQCKPHCCHSNQPLLFSWCALTKLGVLIFLHVFIPNDSAFVYTICVEHTCCSNIISELTVRIKHSISCRTKGCLNPHLVEEATCFLFSSSGYCLNWTP